MVWLFDGEKIVKISVFFDRIGLHEHNSQTDGQPNRQMPHKGTACTYE